MAKLCYESCMPDRHGVLAARKAAGMKNKCMEPVFAAGQAGLHMGLEDGEAAFTSGQVHVQ
jgi:hypothetical protein